MKSRPGIRAALVFCMLFAAFFLLPGICTAVSPGNFLYLFPDKDSGVKSFALLQTESQVNDFPRQRERRPEIDAQGEERHYSEIRESENTFSFNGAKIGSAFGAWPLVYVTAGFAEAEVDFSFTDELTENKDEYSIHTRFETDGFPVFGAGIAASMYSTQVLEDSRFRIGGDLQYRRLDFKAEKGNLYYASDLHEIQLSVAAAVKNISWKPQSWLPEMMLSPYGGVLVAHFIGDEKFRDPKNTDRKGDPDPIRHEADLDPSNHITFFAGTNIELPGIFFLGLETRFGDDKGYGLQMGCSF